MRFFKDDNIFIQPNKIFSSRSEKVQKTRNFRVFLSFYVAALYRAAFFSGPITVLVAEWSALLRARREVAGSAPASALPFLLSKLPAFSLSLSPMA